MADAMDSARGVAATAGAAKSPLHWTPAWRCVVFVLSASSIWCLLSDFYHLMSMRTFALSVMLPSSAALVALAVWDRISGGRMLWRIVLIGAMAGLIAAVAYDVFRLPFVYARAWGIDSVVPPMPLFKVFPRFGAMLLGHSFSDDQVTFTTTESLLGWAYHFSNGLTFGVMYLAIIGDARRRSWLWAVLLAAGLELAMLFTPYPQYFGIKVTAAFIAVTLAAHMIFGAVMGAVSKTGVQAVEPALH